MSRELEVRIFQALGFATGCWDENGCLEVERLLSEGNSVINWIEENYEPRGDFK